jgi:hypothetical protein
MEKNKRGRKPIPENQKKKAVWAVLEPITFTKIMKDVQNGKADTSHQMVTKIVDKYYKKKEEREKNKLKEENTTNSKNSENFIFS